MALPINLNRKAKPNLPSMFDSTPGAGRTIKKSFFDPKYGGGYLDTPDQAVAPTPATPYPQADAAPTNITPFPDSPALDQATEVSPQDQGDVSPMPAENPLDTMRQWVDDMHSQLDQILKPREQPDAVNPVVPNPITAIPSQNPIAAPKFTGFPTDSPIAFNEKSDRRTWTPHSSLDGPYGSAGTPTVPNATQNYYDRAASRALGGSVGDRRRLNRLNFRAGYNSNDNG